MRTKGDARLFWRRTVNLASSRLADACQTASCYLCDPGYLPRLMPKPIARSKTRKAVAKRFKITSRGKVLRSQAAKRHLMSSKNAKRKRQASKTVGVDKTDVKRIKMNLPFG
jgi:large subunit ribosomal protein L35